MTSIMELEKALAGIFTDADQVTDTVADNSGIVVADDVREIRTDLTILAGSRESGN